MMSIRISRQPPQPGWLCRW